MKRALVASALVLAVAAPAAAEAGIRALDSASSREWLRKQDGDSKRATLWPGETLNLGRIAVQWRFSGQAPQQTSELLLSDGGTKLPPIQMSPKSTDVIQPQNTKPQASIGMMAGKMAPGMMPGMIGMMDGGGMGMMTAQAANLDLPAYIRETVVMFPGVLCNSPTPPPKLAVTYWTQPCAIRFPGSEWRGSLWVSVTGPIQLDDWHLTVSPEPLTYPDGSHYHTLTVHDETTSFSIPIAEGSRRDFGRFELSVRSFCPASRTASLGVTVARDTSPMGADSLAEKMVLRGGETFGKFMEEVASEYGFTFEWDPASPPDAVSYLLEKCMMARPGNSYVIATNLLDEALGEVAKKSGLPVALEWKDSTHLILKPTDAAREQMLEEKEKPLELKRMQETFDRDYALQTRVYQPASLRADTLKGIVDRELGAYALLPKGGRGGEVVEEGLYYTIARFPQASDRVSTAARESALVDEKANTVIVTAAPPTHERIAAAIAEVEKLLSKESAPPAAPLHRVEVVLLRGLREAAGATSASALSITKTLLVESELTFRTLRLRVVKVNANDEKNGNDDSVEMVVRTATISEHRTIQEYRSEFVGDYEINVINVTPSANPAESTVMLEVRANQVEPAGVARSGSDYGLTAEDLKVFGIASVEEIGRGVVNLVAEPGETGKARLALGPAYAAELQFLDRRDPYLILRGRLAPSGGDSATLIENTLYLEKGKPAVLGITNLKDVLLLVARLPEGK